MKKIFAVVMIVCLMASLLCFTAFAAEKDTTNEPAEGVVLRVSAQKKDGTIDIIGDYTSFEEGWKVAQIYSGNDYKVKDAGYIRAIVDFYADWNAFENGRFSTNYDDYGYIETFYNCHLTINLNGHTINRGLTDWEYNGEVINIGQGANVIINDGTITGGFSCNGAGGIHIDDRATVVLNNVNVVGNAVEDDDGAAIAVYDGATLIMNGGSLSDNVIYSSEFALVSPYGALYLNDSTAYLKDVKIENNILTGFHSTWGVAIYVDDGNLTMENCTIKGNGYKDSSKKHMSPMSIITIDEGTMEFKNCVFENNGTPGNTTGPDVISVYGGDVKISNSKILNNASDSIIFGVDGSIEVSDSHFEGNTGNIYYGKKKADSIFKDCNFVGSPTNTESISFFLEKNSNMELNTCNLGSSTFNDESCVTFVNCYSTDKSNNAWKSKLAGSTFGTGSLTMIISLFALIASGVSIFMIANLKKKLVPVAANVVAKTDEEDEG